MIQELLSAGETNAKTASQLAVVLNCEVRDVTRLVEQERRAGAPICANSAGYYLAADKNDMRSYCNRLRKRAGEVFKTRRALLKTVEGLPDAPEE